MALSWVASSAMFANDATKWGLSSGTAAMVYSESDVNMGSRALINICWPLEDHCSSKLIYQIFSLRKELFFLWVQTSFLRNLTSTALRSVSYNLTILQQWKCMLPLRTLAWTVPNTWSDQAKPSASKPLWQRNRFWQNAQNISMFEISPIPTLGSYWHNLMQLLHFFGCLSQLQKETTAPIFWERVEFKTCKL